MEFLASAVNANIEVYNMLQDKKRYLKKELDVGAGGDISRVVDIEAETIFVKHLSKFGKIISEESGEIGDDNRYSIVIDPIDGSDNFVSEFPYFGSSLALLRDGVVVEGLIANFATKELYYKKKDTPLLVGTIGKDDFLEVNVDNYATIGVYERVYASKKFVHILNEKGIKYRSPGALALSLAMAHSFRFVIFEGFAREYDISAGIFMCQDLNIYKNSNFLIVSKDKELFDELVSLSRGL